MLLNSLYDRVHKQQKKRGYGNMTHVLRILNFVSCRSVLNGYKGRVLIMP